MSSRGYWRDVFRLEKSVVKVHCGLLFWMGKFPFLGGMKRVWLPSDFLLRVWWKWPVTLLWDAQRGRRQSRDRPRRGAVRAMRAYLGYSSSRIRVAACASTKSSCWAMEVLGSPVNKFLFFYHTFGLPCGGKTMGMIKRQTMWIIFLVLSLWHHSLNFFPQSACFSAFL